MKTITCVGSRKTPIDILEKMTGLGASLAAAGFTGRSGHADGADLAFEIGFNGNFEVYLPWNGFNKKDPYLGNVYIAGEDLKAREIASRLHPRWDMCSFGVKKLHTRNVHQVLGFDLNAPSCALICWTEDGKKIGGTATAISLAEECGIPVYNMALIDHMEILKKVTGH